MTRQARELEFVAHRGARSRFPENTLAAIAGALDCGLQWVEIDVQFSADGHPVVIHDETLERTAGRPGVVGELSLQALTGISVHEPRRLDATHGPEPVPTLSQAVALLDGHPRARLFVEIRLDGIRRFGRDRVLEQVNRAMGPWHRQCIVLSYDLGIVEMARKAYGHATGWVMHRYDGAEHMEALRAKPDFLFVDSERPPADEPLLPGPWTWVVYEISTLEQARYWHDRGAGLAESYRACELSRQVRETGLSGS